MDKKQATLVVKVLAIIGIIFGALRLLASLAFMGMGAFMGLQMEGMMGLGGLMGGFAIVGLLLASFQIFVWFMVLKYVNWARIVAIILGVISLISVPIGTIFGIAVIYFLGFNKDVVKLFR